MTTDAHSALDAFEALPAIPLWPWPSPVHELRRLRERLGEGPRLLIKRDDLIGFGFGGNKVRKLEVVAARALEEGADTLVTTGGIQSNHARVTAIVAACLGLRCHLVLNGEAPPVLNGNLLLSTLAAAEVHYVATRAERAPSIGALVQRLAREGLRPFLIPLGASTPHGALGFGRAVTELLDQVGAPDVIVHSTSSGGTQAGLLAGVALHRMRTRVVGISADDPADTIAAHVRALLQEMDGVLGIPGDSLAPASSIEIDDRFVGPGYGLPSEASKEAARLLLECEGIVLDPVYTSKAMAGLIARIRERRYAEHETVLFWHTGGLPALFA